MNDISLELINRALVLDDYDNDPFFTEDAIGYLNYLLSPYIEAMKNADDASIRAWIYQQFSGRTLDRINNNLDDNLQDIKESVIIGLLQTIIYDSDIIEIEDYVSSWNIKQQLELEYNKDIAEFFNITKVSENSEFPVTVTLNGYASTANMTFELVLGIIALYDAIDQQHPLSLFGITFLDYKEFINRLVDRGNKKYSVTVNNLFTYYFTDIQFMTGLITASQWNKIDPHVILTDLKQYISDNLINVPALNNGVLLNF